MHLIYLAVAILAEVVATTALKESNGFTKLYPSLLTTVGYGIAFYFLSLALRDIPTGVAYAIWSAIGIVLVTLVAWHFHGQTLDRGSIAGMVLIVTGVIVMNVFSRVTAH